VAKLTEVVFSLNEAEWNLLLSAKSRQESHHLNRLKIIAHDNEFGLAFFNKGGYVVESIFKMDWLITNVLILVSILSSFSLSLKSFFFLRLSFR